MQCRVVALQIVGEDEEAAGGPRCQREAGGLKVGAPLGHRHILLVESEEGIVKTTSAHVNIYPVAVVD